MSDRIYLLDSNVVTQLGTRRVLSSYVRAHCRVPSEVAYEAGDERLVAALKEIEVAVGIGTLRRLSKVMSTLSPGEFDLVDLFKNQGNADPLLVATVLDQRDQEAETLFQNDWVIATEDRAVRALSDRFDIPTIGTSGLAVMIDEDGS